MSDIKPLPDTQVSVSYWDLDCLLDWAVFADGAYDLDEDVVERLRSAQRTGDDTVYGAEAERKPQRP